MQSYDYILLFRIVQIYSIFLIMQIIMNVITIISNKYIKVGDSWVITIIDKNKRDYEFHKEIVYVDQDKNF